jgi:protein-tyrosine phosphatase
VKSVLFVCLGNICRSPLGEGILRRDAEAQGLDLRVDSAGTGDWHVGELPDPRARRVGQDRGCAMDMRARQVRSTDFRDFDVIVAMDRSNFRELLRWPGADASRVKLASSFDVEGDLEEVPDPYYGDLSGFEDVADQLERISLGILAEMHGAVRRYASNRHAQGKNRFGSG